MYGASCGNPVGEHAVFCGRCGHSVGRAAAPVRYASFWARVAATFIDLLLILPVALTLWIASGRSFTDDQAALVNAKLRGERVPEAQFLNVENRGLLKTFELACVVFLVGWPYFAWLESSPAQATVGKMALGLRVTDLDGRRIRWARATGRYWARWLSQLPSCIGFLLPLFTAKKQALHDMASGCLVLKK